MGRTCRSNAKDAVCGSAHAISGVALPKRAFLIPPTDTLLAEPNETADETDIAFKLIYPGGAPAGGATVQLVFTDPAVRGTDYSFPGPDITLAAGESEKTLSLRIRHDQVLEADEQFSIAVDGIEDDSDMGYSDDAHELTITDLADALLLPDDAPKQLVFEAQVPGPHRLRLQTSYDRPVVLPDFEFDKRSFTLQAESYAAAKPAKSAAAPIVALWTVNASHDSDTALYEPDDPALVKAAGNLEAYAQPGDDNVYWREGDSPYDHRYLEVDLGPIAAAHDRYRLTLVKPDFAITKRPVRTKKRADGSYQVTLNLYNAESYDSSRRDANVRIRTYCTDGVTRSLLIPTATSSFAELRGRYTYLLPAQRERGLNITVLCPTGAYLERDKIVAVAQVINNYGRSNELEGPWAHGNWNTGFTGPDREDTLWAPQKKDVAGGLSMATPVTCTLSFVLDLQRIGRSTAVPAASTTGHCADDGAALYKPW
ncbi:MAG: hypothetical protein F4Y67_03075 [Chloroflexi bacterium]|nr:hypothetical protein [Chloroflexota bacterium]